MNRKVFNSEGWDASRSVAVSVNGSQVLDVLIRRLPETPQAQDQFGVSVMDAFYNALETHCDALMADVEVPHGDDRLLAELDSLIGDVFGEAAEQPQPVAATTPVAHSDGVIVYGGNGVVSGIGFGRQIDWTQRRALERSIKEALNDFLASVPPLPRIEVASSDVDPLDAMLAELKATGGLWLPS
ncbi:hypothetical protein [Tessaracoccus sp. OH4464_COT-324]|uniref:hypothetical protein n=1 Tax=Tessaracoccus sp. OH4464_COT-324 TaxID=2491059 RepID=UPI000F63C1D0|nr:hypothetical protein [Tessaracoccus sp. OH4464_COT-324]RRD46360.1 hypothetical protein EII42_07575 [Tessaracoccus sp. OH4464_COT-324]